MDMENLSQVPEASSSEPTGLDDILARSRAIFERTKQLIDAGDLHQEQISFLAAQSERLVDDSTLLLGKLKKKNAGLEAESDV